MTAAGLPAGGTLSIGAVLARLKPEFPDVSISKIRFLESEGLVTPERTPSGYRQFSVADVERLRYVLTAQRDLYLPLKVIKESLDQGVSPIAGLAAPRAVHVVGAAPAAPAPERLGRAELLARHGWANTLLRELEQLGLVQMSTSGYFEGETVAVAGHVAELLKAGWEPRHLRPLRNEADRAAGMIGQQVSGTAKRRDPDAREQAVAAADQLAATVAALHAALLRSALRRDLP